MCSVAWCPCTSTRRCGSCCLQPTGCDRSDARMSVPGGTVRLKTTYVVTLLDVFPQAVDVLDILDGPVLQQDLDQFVGLERLGLDPLLVITLALLLCGLGWLGDAAG